MNAYEKGLLRSLDNDSVARIVMDVAEADAADRFPAEAVSCLRSAGFFRYGVPTAFGGDDFTVDGFAAIAERLGSLCTSTAVIWAMHCQQVITLACADFPERAQVLARQLAYGPLIASVTTEYTSSNLVEPVTVAHVEGERVRLQRRAPIVSYGREAERFLTTASLVDGEQSSPALLLIDRADGDVSYQGEWKSMGMRGTQSVPMAFDVSVPRGRVVAAPMGRLVARVFVPLGHLAYAAAWYGASKGAFGAVVRRLREKAASGAKNLNSEILRARLAHCRLKLHFMNCLVTSAVRRIECALADEAEARDVSFSVEINNAKLGASMLAFEVMDVLMELLGVADGYLRTAPFPFERVYRDLRSASLMYHNDRLLSANGQLVFLEAALSQDSRVG